MACALWGDGSKWGDGDLWCREISVGPYVSFLDQDTDRPLLSSWTLQSPDATIWSPTISSQGVLTFTSGAGSLSTAPVLIEDDNTLWSMAIGNTGVLTLTDGVADTNQPAAEVIDPNAIAWYGRVSSLNVLRWQTGSVPGNLRTRLTHVSVRVSYSAAAAFVIHSIRPLLAPVKAVLGRYITHTDMVTKGRVSVRITYTGNAAFVVDRIALTAKSKKQRPRG
jgi:hypothetical protein